MNINKYVVIKLGSSITTNIPDEVIHKDRFRELGKQTKILFEHGFGVIFVISGSVTCGKHSYEDVHTNDSISPSLASGIGQGYILENLRSIFKENNMFVSQMLLTKADIKNIGKREVIKRVLEEAMHHGIVSILNENDIIEINSFQGNDFLASEIAKLIHAEYLLLLTDVEGVYDENMEIIKIYPSDNTKELAFFEKKAEKGFGGIAAKICAAQDAAKTGIQTFIANGKVSNTIKRILLDNEHIGTKFN